MAVEKNAPEDKKPTQTLAQIRASRQESSSGTTTSSVDKDNDEKGKTGYTKPEEVVPAREGTDDTSITKSQETLEKEDSSEARNQAEKNREEEKKAQKEHEKDLAKSKVHKAYDRPSGRRTIYTNDTEKVLEEVDEPPHRVDIVNNAAHVWTGDRTLHYDADLADLTGKTDKKN